MIVHDVVGEQTNFYGLSLKKSGIRECSIDNVDFKKFLHSIDFSGFTGLCRYVHGRHKFLVLGYCHYSSS